MATQTQDSETIPMKSRIVQKFYEPLVLLKALNLEMQDKANYVDPDELDNRRDMKHTFQAFVYKLAHACDSVKGDGGATITSVMVLNATASDSVEYWFASNQRTTEELQITALFIGRILNRASRATLPQDESRLRRDLLDLVLGFNRQRIAQYLAAFRVEGEKCLKMCSTQDNEEDNTVSTHLRKALNSINFAWDESTTEAEWTDLRKCNMAIRSLTALKASDAGECIAQRARHIRESGLRDSSVSCWPEMRHMMNRLLAYAQDVEFFLVARKNWPQLFTNSRILFLPSSPPIQRPGRRKSMTAEGIVGRMTRKEQEMAALRGFVRELQLMNLDQRIREEYGKKTFAPIVHSEVLLLNKLEKSGGTSPERFFNGWVYIGSSKPLCRLCQYFFEEHRSGVEHRSSDENLYISWRVPDVRVSEGELGEESRQIMVDRMLRRIRKDAINLIRKTVHPTFRDHDSLTSSVRLTLDGRWGTISDASDVSDVASVMGSLALGDVEDDEGGGVALA
ncbi:hypothetical protein CSHISOI_07123 [Colletotrichum shisoi]|uniref:Uncharacterized protein n=1 Tax=Colletotrichum shisoi TaxID=2078593 RepID=A0A5Q4BNY8_9PEZI|nr:hypothetical protein CSHISOI_07123 [Colletotrichum shisoi]